MASIYGIENPLMDMIFQADLKTLGLTGAVPGTMNLVDFPTVQRILSLNPAKGAAAFTRTPGGSCANTMRGIAWLAGSESGFEPPVFSGAVGRDETGAEFEKLLRDFGVRPSLAFTDSPTGTSIILVTPDHERTMFTFLGACREYGKRHLELSEIGRSRWLYSTGYMWDTPNQCEAIRAAVEHALAAGVKIAFDLADPFVVRRSGAELARWIPGRVEVLFANREELSTMTGVDGSYREIVTAAAGLAPVIVMKTGRDGCVIARGGEFHEIRGEHVIPVDTTGAGDAFAAGFMYGVLSDRSLEESGRLANRIASRIVTVEGCNYSRIDRIDVLNGLR